MNAKDLLKKYINQVNLMQLATSENNRPWACTVHFYADDDLNLYWTSAEDRKHSQHIKQNHNTAVAIVVHENSPEEDYVIGVSMAGQAEYIGEQTSEDISRGYVNKLGRDPELLNDIANGKTPFKFYRFTPEQIILFDNKDFPDNPRQEINLSS